VLSRRKRRAIAFGAAAVIVLIVAGFVYLRPSLPVPSTPTSLTAAKPGDATPGFVMYDYTSPTVAWALGFPPESIGSLSVSRTIDGGKHWQKRLSRGGNPAVSSPPFIRFFDDTRGFVATRDGQLLRTVDGGASWKVLNLPESRGSYLNFRDERHGWLIAPVAKGIGQLAYLYSTEDAGGSWHKLPDPPAGAALFSSRRTESWLATYKSGSPIVYRSIDGGLSWQPRDIPIDKATTATGPWNSMVILLPGDGVIASTFCDCGTAYRPFSFVSFDGGATWRLLTLPGEGPYSVAYQDDFHWFTIAAGTLYRTSDGGQTWTKASAQLPDWRFQPHAIDSTHAWAQIGLNEGYGLATTADAGLHWTRVTIPQST
jgi:photosystem II stability/assembly factor-like uncharacterized protein